jgi:hypothetical protein
MLPPVPRGDELLVDGGVLNNLPADVMRADPSIRTVVAVDVTPPAGPRATVDYGLHVSGWRALGRSVRVKGVGLLALGRIDKVIDAGYRSTRPQIRQWLDAGPTGGTVS